MVLLPERMDHEEPDRDIDVGTTGHPAAVVSPTVDFLALLALVLTAAAAVVVLL
jgi:hypothetical protein